MISVVILTHNEESDLPGCLESVRWSNDVHVLDSGSTDNTISISERYGAKVTLNSFESFGKQRNFALDNLTLINDWILFLDADEVVTDKFRLSITEATQSAEQTVAGFYCCWKMMLDGKWLKHSDNFPKWQFRLLRKDRARFTDFGHGQKEGDVQGEIRYVKEPYLHFGFSKGWFHWLARHNKYSSQEAVSRLNNTPPFKNVFAAHGSVRNPALKSWLIRIPFWPLLRFVFSYILKFGFVEGKPGLIYCVNMSYYEFLIQIKIRELKNRNLHKKGI